MSGERNAFGVWKSGQVGPVLAVFRSAKKAYVWMVQHSDLLSMRACTWKEAVGAIREQVYARDEGRCVACGALVTPATMHMDERHDKGKGGEVSVRNCETRCSACHIGPRGKHGGRCPQFGKMSIGFDPGGGPDKTVFHDGKGNLVDPPTIAPAPISENEKAAT